MDQKLQILLDTVRKLVRRGAYPNLTKVIDKTHPADIAALFRYLEPKEQRVLFNLIENAETAAYVLSEIDHSTGARLLQEIDKEAITEILQEMPYDDAVDIIRNMPEELAEEILSIMQDEHSEEIEQLLRYDEDTAGGIMSTEIFSLNENLTVREAIEELQKSAENVEMVFYIYVTNEHKHLVGVLSLRQLLTVPPHTKLKDIMITDVISVRTDMDQEEVAHLVAKYNILAVPVVDESNKLMGIITVDDVIAPVERAPQSPVAAAVRVAVYDERPERPLPAFDGAGTPLGTLADIGRVRMYPEGLSFPAPERTLSHDLAGMRLVGYDLAVAAAPAGARLSLALHWLGLARMDQAYTIFVHLVDGEGNLVAQADAPPMDGHYDTLYWWPGDCVRSLSTLEVPASALAEPLTLRLGIYLPDSGVRVMPAGTNGRDYIEIGPFSIRSTGAALRLEGG